MRRLYIIILCLCSCLTTLQAQNNETRYRDIYDQAEEDYSIGRLEQAEQQLKNHIKDFPVTLQMSAYRLLALCYIGMDRDEDASSYVRQLLAENPYYSPTISDPQRFIDMVEDIKSGLTATITTASSQAESLAEVPVPTTLITEQMIQDCGGRNLQEVLAAYVPGMNIVDCNDDINIGMRGIYSTGQEKILIMLNGHRLNSYATNIAAPDFSISLKKIKQIEVLRGPASSLYGGVSLTAVVNIITKQGADVNGVEIHGGAGSYGQLRGDAMLGKRYFDVDFLLWGSIYRAKGEKRFVPSLETGLMSSEGDAIIGGVGKKPSYDVGLALKYKGLQFLYNARFSQIVSPLTMTYLYSPYNIDKYRTFNGIWPGFTTLSHHGDLSYSRQLGKVWLKGTVTYDNSDLTHYQVIAEEPTQALMGILPIPDVYRPRLEGKGGFFRYINGQEHTFGAKLQGDWSYLNNGSHKGQLTFGGEFSYFQLEDVRYTFGYDHDSLINETNAIAKIGTGHESNLNGFAQLKHQWGPFILNGGMRFDYKQRYDDSHIREFSPRLALIFMQPKWNIKASYSKSFIDAPYLYRKTNLVVSSMFGYKVPETLDPETLHSWQLTFSAVEWAKGLNFEINGFYNRARDLIYMLVIEHSNSGDMNSFGLEISGHYERPRFSAHLNTTWQVTTKNEILLWNVDRAVNTPKFMANGVFAWKPLPGLNLHTHLNYYGKQKTFYLDIAEYGRYQYLDEEYAMKLAENMKTPGKYSEEELQEIEDDLGDALEKAASRIDVSDRLLVNVGANYTLGPVTFSFDVHNLLNKRYWQSGMATGLIPQQGRWFLGSIGVKL